MLISAPSPNSSPLKSLPPSIASSPNTTVRLSCPSQPATENGIRVKRSKATGSLSDVSETDVGMNKVRKMLDMSQNELNISNSSENVVSQLSIQPPSAISPVLPQIPTAVTIPTMMKQPMPLMPTVPLPQSSLRSSPTVIPTTKVLHMYQDTLIPLYNFYCTSKHHNVIFLTILHIYCLHSRLLHLPMDEIIPHHLHQLLSYW